MCSSSAISSAATTCPAWPRTRCRAVCTPPPASVTTLAGKPREPYRYRDLGSAAYISRGHAVLQVGPVRLAGFLGWLAWGFIHIAFLTGVQNRISTVGTWLAHDRPRAAYRPHVHAG